MTEPAKTEPKKRRGKEKVVIHTPIHTFEGEKDQQLEKLFGQWYGCTRCDLCQFRAQTDTGSVSPEIVFGEGNRKADLLIIGEAPGEEEEATSVPFVGNSGKLLNQLLAMFSDQEDVREAFAEYYKSPRTGARGEKAVSGFHEYVTGWRHAEFFITNAVACRPPENRTPTQHEIEACWERLLNIIYIVDPLLIVTCGSSALSAVLRKAKISLSDMRGKIYDASFQGKIGPLKYPVLPTFHPSYLLRKADYKATNGDWTKTVEDWRRAFQILDFLRSNHYGTPIPKRG